MRFLFTLLGCLLLAGTTLALPTSALPRPAEEVTTTTKADKRRARFERRVERLRRKLDKRLEKRRAAARAMDRDTRNWVILGGAALLLLIVLGAGGILANILGLILGLILVVAIVVAAIYLLTGGF